MIDNRHNVNIAWACWDIGILILGGLTGILTSDDSEISKSDILNNNCQLVDYITLNKTYDIRASFLDMIQIRSSIPIEWKETLKQCSLMPKNIPSGNNIKIKNKMKAIEKVTCKEFYWHLINKDVHNPSSVKIWSSQDPIFKEASTNVWPRIFKLPLITVRDNKIQTFQYRFIQITILCNKWLHNIKIKNCSVCDYCMNVDDLPHFFIRCLKVKEFWLHWLN